MSEGRRRRRRLDDDITVQGVHLALDAAVCVLGVLFLVPGVIVLEGVPLVVCVQAVLLDQGLGEREGGQEDCLCQVTYKTHSEEYLAHPIFKML